MRDASQTGALGGAVRHAKAAGRSATLRTQARQISFVTSMGPGRGKAQVWLDGVRVATIDLYASRVQPARVVWVRAFRSLETHTLRIVVTGTKRFASTSTRVDIDAFLVQR